MYDGAKHGFSNPHADERVRGNGIGLGYHAQATKQSWAKMIAFMNDAL
nr:dienelactone hydrolase family protein [Moraxella catarrhalis]